MWVWPTAASKQVVQDAKWLAVGMDSPKLITGLGERCELSLPSRSFAENDFGPKFLVHM